MVLAYVIEKIFVKPVRPIFQSAFPTFVIDGDPENIRATLKADIGFSFDHGVFNGQFVNADVGFDFDVSLVQRHSP